MLSQSTEPVRPEPRVVKKYPNRRLYDTETSSYITVAEVKQLVMKKVPLVVRDAKTGEDLTRSILLQIILEEEAGGAPIFTEQVLTSMIRFYGNTMQSCVGPYLERNMQTFVDLQTRLGEQSGTLTPEAWARFMTPGLMGGHVEQSAQLFLQMQEQIKKQREQVLEAIGIKR